MAASRGKVTKHWVDLEWESEGAMVPMGTQAFTIPGVGGSGGFKIVLKNCKIHAESIIIKKIDSKPKRKK